MATQSLSFPTNSTQVVLQSNFEIKQWWMYKEWDGSNPKWKAMIQSDFPNRNDLDPSNQNPQIQRIQELFSRMRGSFSDIWGHEREKAEWTKVDVGGLDPNWVRDNVTILYPCDVSFESATSDLNGLVRWKKPGTQKYDLIEGNHRISAWLNSANPQPLPSILFIGKA